MGILNSDSGRESILKVVLERNGLSGMSLLLQEASEKIDNIETKIPFPDMFIILR